MPERVKKIPVLPNIRKLHGFFFGIKVISAKFCPIAWNSSSIQGFLKAFCEFKTVP